MQSFPVLCVLAVASVVTFVKGDLKLFIIKKRIEIVDSSIFRYFWTENWTPNESQVAQSREK